jgi:phosphosulfolactate synthase (CoM biosynthesis protein A)
MLSKDGLKAVLIAKLVDKGFPLSYEVQGKVQDTGLEKLCDAIAEAVVEYITMNAEVHIIAGSVVVAVSGIDVVYTMNPTDIILKVV